MDKIFTLYIYWNPSREMFPWDLPLLGRPILWYGFFFALGFFLAYLVFQKILIQFLKPNDVSKKEITKLIEKLSFYVVIGTIIGARLGDVLFYQNPMEYVQDPLSIFKFWEGGLSSHGGIVGVLIGLWIFCKRIQKKYPMLSWTAMLDLLSIPGLLAGGFIRIGNFFNQEIIGTATKMPWGVIFQNPADHSVVLPRHPVQLYEALFYFAFFAVLVVLRSNNAWMQQLGKTSGLFFIGTFLFRFFIEFFKSTQCSFLTNAFFDMGQLLSIPMVLVGIFLVVKDFQRASC